MKDMEIKNKKEFILLRGASGSGKSFLAKQLAGDTGQQFAADDYFVDEQGNYNWSGEKVSAANYWNYERVKKAVDEGISPVILDNTNISRKDLRASKDIIAYAESKGYETRIEETKTSWAFDAEELVKRNSHGVGIKTIQRQIRRWVFNPSIDDIKGY